MWVKTISKTVTLIFRTVLTALWFVFLLIFIWALCFHWHCLCFLLLPVVFLFLPLRIKNRPFIKIRLILFSIMVFLSISTFEISISELNKRIMQLAAKPRDQNSLSVFSLRDKLGIYGLNVIMGAVAYPFYPETSKETLMMVFKSPPNSKRTFESDFALGSARVRNVLEGFLENLETNHEEKEQFKKQISWPIEEYRFGNKEARYALALNPADISILAMKQNSSWVIEVRLQVRCEYPKNSYVTLISKPELKMEEGLFWVLQQSGWLHPYIAEYHFHLYGGENNLDRINRMFSR
jgi:hypothetical protein